MLFHVTMTHTVEECPGYNPEKMREWIASSDKLEDIAKQMGVKVHFDVNVAPEHVAYALLEAEELSSVLAVLNAIPIRQDFKATPVLHNKDLIAMAKAMMEQK